MSSPRQFMQGKTFVKYEKEADKLRMGGGSWSINLDTLPADAEAIIYITETNKYYITLADAWTYGFSRTLGGEKKLIVPLKSWQRENETANAKA